MNMNVYEVETPLNISNRAYVVAPDMGEAERVFHEKYRLVKITAIKLVSSGPVFISPSAKESGPVRRWDEWTEAEQWEYMDAIHKRSMISADVDLAIDIALRGTHE